MPRVAVRKIELRETITAPQAVEEYEGVRFYCTLDGQVLGHLTIWNNYRPISREWLLDEITCQMTPLLSNLLLGITARNPRQAKRETEMFVKQQLMRSTKFKGEI